jgi:hypothetical protein
MHSSEALALIGTLDEAQEIFELNERLPGPTPITRNLPEGWEFIDSGGTRRVFRGPSGICYKVNYEDREGKPNYNDLEHRNFRRIDQEGNASRRAGGCPGHTFIDSVLT